MFERYTERALQVVMISQEEARRAGLYFVGSEQLLLALLGEGTGIAWRVLTALGLDLKKLRNEIEQVIGPGFGYKAIEVPFTPRARRAFEIASHMSYELQHGYIGTEHLLLGLVADRQGVAVALLNFFDIEAGAVERRTIDEIKRDNMEYYEAYAAQQAKGFSLPKKKGPLTLSERFQEDARQAYIIEESQKRYRRAEAEEKARKAEEKARKALEKQEAQDKVIKKYRETYKNNFSVLNFQKSSCKDLREEEAVLKAYFLSERKEKLDKNKQIAIDVDVETDLNRHFLKLQSLNFSSSRLKDLKLLEERKKNLKKIIVYKEKKLQSSIFSPKESLEVSKENEKMKNFSNNMPIIEKKSLSSLNRKSVFDIPDTNEEKESVSKKPSLENLALKKPIFEASFFETSTSEIPIFEETLLEPHILEDNASASVIKKEETLVPFFLQKKVFDDSLTNESFLEILNSNDPKFHRSFYQTPEKYLVLPPFVRKETIKHQKIKESFKKQKQTNVSFKIKQFKKQRDFGSGWGKPPYGFIGFNDNRDSRRSDFGKNLVDFTKDLTIEARMGQLDPVVGRDKEIERVIQILCRRRKNNPILLGEPGVGKTAIAEGLALRIVGNNVPDALKDKNVVVLDVGLLLAGTKYRGEFEERLKRILDDVITNGEMIMVIDEIHTLVGAGSAEGSLDAANMIKPALARGEMQCLGATTLEEFRKYIQKDPALERRFQPVIVDEPSIEETIIILNGLRYSYEEHHELLISDAAIAACARLSKQYIADRFLPDKAIDLMDEAGSRVRLRGVYVSGKTKNLEIELKRTLEEQENCVRFEAYEKAAQYRDRAKDLKRLISKSLEGDAKQKEKMKATMVEPNPDSDPYLSFEYAISPKPKESLEEKEEKERKIRLEKARQAEENRILQENEFKKYYSMSEEELEAELARRAEETKRRTREREQALMKEKMENAVKTARVQDEENRDTVKEEYKRVEKDYTRWQEKIYNEKMKEFRDFLLRGTTILENELIVNNQDIEREKKYVLLEKSAKKNLALDESFWNELHKEENTVLTKEIYNYKVKHDPTFLARLKKQEEEEKELEEAARALPPDHSEYEWGEDMEPNELDGDKYENKYEEKLRLKKLRGKTFLELLYLIMYQTRRMHHRSSYYGEIFKKFFVSYIYACRRKGISTPEEKFSEAMNFLWEDFEEEIDTAENNDFEVPNLISEYFGLDDEDNVVSLEDMEENKKKDEEEDEMLWSTAQKKRGEDIETLRKKYAEYNDLDMEIIKSLRDLLTPIVTEEDIAEVVSAWTGIPLNKVTQDETQKLAQLEKTLHGRIIGQNQAVNSIARAVRRSRVGLRSPNRPIASFLFSGPTGVGKTELAKALASFIFGSESSMVRLDMSEFMERHTVSKLIGSPPGYVGYEEGGQLTEAVRRKAYSLVLLDEIEKGHPDVFNLLLQILDDGRLTDGKGRVIDFKNTIVIMTSNLGSQAIVEASNKLNEENSNTFLGSGKLSANGISETRYSKLHAIVNNELQSFFKPEFLNRIDEVIVFEQLNKFQVAEIAKLMIDDLVKRLLERNIVLTVSTQVIEIIVDLGYNQNYGARPLRRAITEHIEDKVASKYLEYRNVAPGVKTKVIVSTDENKKIIVNVIPPVVKAQAEKRLYFKENQLPRKDSIIAKSWLKVVKSDYAAYKALKEKPKNVIPEYEKINTELPALDVPHPDMGEMFEVETRELELA